MTITEFIESTYNEYRKNMCFPTKVTRIVHELCEKDRTSDEIFITKFFNDERWNNKSRSIIIDDCLERANNFFVEFGLEGWKVKCAVYSEFLNMNGSEYLLQCIQQDSETGFKIYPLESHTGITANNISEILNETINPITAC